ncbi:MAG: MFS transporter [Anaerolineae bacterium]|nr:MFS transporter [Anaerolineae bacterium]
MQYSSADASRKWFVLVAVGLSMFVTAMHENLVSIAIPELVNAFDSDFNTMQWLSVGYFLSLAVTLVSMGRLGDMIGKKKVFVAGFGVLALGVFLLGLAPNAALANASRPVVGVGAALALSVGIGILTEDFPPRQRGLAIGLIGLFISAGVVLGPLVGGLLLRLGSWRWLFLTTAPLNLIGMFFAMRYVPDSPARPGQRFDIPGALTFGVALLALLLALTLPEGQQAASLSPLKLYGIAAVLMAVFVVIELRTAQPMLDLRVFRDLALTLNLIILALFFFGMFGHMLMFPFYLSTMRGFETGLAGILLALIFVGYGAGAPFAGRLVDRYGASVVQAGTLLLLVVGYALVMTLNLDTTPAGFVLRVMLMFVAIGSLQVANNTAIMGAASQEQLGVISGVLSTARAVGQTLGVAGLGALWSARVNFHSGAVVDTTTAAPLIQVQALNEMTLVALLAAALALGLAIWEYVVTHGWKLPVRVIHPAD